MRTLVDISRQLSFILRHNPQSIGITLDEHGLVKEILVPMSVDKKTLEEVVRTDRKGRGIKKWQMR